MNNIFRMCVILIVLGIVSAPADPFNTVSGYPLPPRAGYAGLSVPITLPLSEDYNFAAHPTIWLGYGILSRVDATLMAYGIWENNDIYPGYAMAELRYDVVGHPRLAISPVFDLYLPLSVSHPWAIGPGLTASGDLGVLLIHTNLFTYLALGDSGDEVAVYLAGEIPLGEKFSTYVEANMFISLQKNQPGEERSDPVIELWPGLNWMPNPWLSVNAAFGIPASLDYVSPGAAVYLNF